MATRLKDIADHLQLSLMTVSKVLRNHPDISEKTRARVMKHVREIDYRPNLAARSLVTGRTYAIGLIVPDLVHPFFGEVAKAFSRILRNTGYSLVLSSSEGDAALERQEIDLLLSRQVDVLVLATSQTSAASLHAFEQRKTPYILIDRSLAGLDCNFVGSDDLEVGRIAAQHLIDAGCTRIAHIGGPEISTALNRAEGFRQSLRERGFRLPRQYVITRKYDSDAGDVTGYKAMERLLALKPRPDGVFCYNDPTAMGAMRAVLEAGLGVPADVAIMGCGNVTYAGFMRVPLTSVDQQSQMIGETSARLALSLLEKNSRSVKRVVLRPRLVKRESTNRSKKPLI